MAEDTDIENDAGVYRRVEPHRRKLLVVTALVRFREHPAPAANLADEMPPEGRLSTGTQSASFLTTPLLTQLHNEPLCAAARL